MFSIAYLRCPVPFKKNLRVNIIKTEPWIFIFKPALPSLSIVAQPKPRTHPLFLCFSYGPISAPVPSRLSVTQPHCRYLISSSSGNVLLSGLSGLLLTPRVHSSAFSLRDLFKIQIESLLVIPSIPTPFI